MTDRVIETAGARLRIRDTGDSEVALLFLHYWGGSSATWRLVTNLLDDRLRCIAIDQRGWGRSIVTDERYDLSAMADDVERIVRDLNLGRYVLVGQSMGGKVAQIVAARRPKELNGLVLVAPSPLAPMTVPAERRAAMLASYESREGVLQALSILTASPLQDDLREQVIADTLRGVPDAKQAWVADGMTRDFGSELSPVTMPVDVVVGERDQVEPPGMLQQKIPLVFPDATFTTIPGAGHLLPLEAPDGVAAVCLNLLGRI